MDSTLALSAINGILAACDEKTRQSVLKELCKPQPRKLKKHHNLTVQQAKEELIKKYFKKS